MHIKLKQLLTEIGAGMPPLPPEPVAHVQNVYQDIRKINKYEPYAIPNSCVISSILFEIWFKEQFPGNWSQMLIVTLDGKENTGHEVVAFEMDGSLFAWDIRIGVLPLPGATKSVSVLKAAVDQEYKNSRAKSKIKTKDIGPGAEVYTLYDMIHGHYPVIVARYDGNDYLAVIVENNGKKRMSLYYPDRGTQSAEFPSSYSPKAALEYMFKNIFDGNGKYTTRSKETFD